jgi:UDP-N-acetyl-2-amino-2-deoxyglucuronate dehydrogenase
MNPQLTRTVAIVGCGSIAPIHLQALAELPQVRLTALVDPDRAAATKLDQLWQKLRPAENQTGLAADDQTALPAASPALAWYESLDELLQAQSIDVVHICTPHHTHVPLAILAMNHGCHVLLEKPVAINREGMDQLQAAARSARGQLGVCLQNRYNRASVQARRLLASGDAGPIHAARGFVTWWRDAAYYRQGSWRGQWATEGGGLMINQAIHTLDLMLWLVGQPQSLAGQICNVHLQGQIEVEDTAHAHIQFTNGATGVFFASNAYPASARTFLEIACERMVLRLEQDDLILLDLAGEPLPPDQWPDVYRASLPQAASASAADGPASDPGSTALPAGKSYWGQGHSWLIQDFYDHLASGIPFPVDLAAGSLALQAVLNLYAASQTGQRQAF